jgi:murein DD-endopeptidase MepM/ murein hydrolase activator NlpD
MQPVHTLMAAVLTAALAGGAAAADDDMTDRDAAAAPESDAPAPSTVNMRMPFAHDGEWKVVTGYNAGPCHFKSSPCGGDEYYALDLVPATGNAKGMWVVAPTSGTVVYSADHGTIGQLLQIRLSTGDTLHLYHLSGVTLKAGDAVSGSSYIGKVYGDYQGDPARNHLHVQVTNSAGASLPLKLSGKLYGDKGTAANQWKDQKVRNNVLYDLVGYGGSLVTIVGAGYVNSMTSLDNAVSSLRLNQDCTFTGYDLQNLSGTSASTSASVSDLGAFSNRMSSWRLTCP